MTATKYTPAQLTAAISACEEMEAGRELDVKINAALGGKISTLKMQDRAEDRGLHGAPTYTSSPYDLTAAMELVPDGWYWRIGVGHYHKPWAMVDKDISKLGSTDGVAAASSASHALTLAALRAQLSCTQET